MVNIFVTGQKRDLERLRNEASLSASWWHDTAAEDSSEDQFARCVPRLVPCPLGDLELLCQSATQSSSGLVSTQGVLAWRNDTVVHLVRSETTVQLLSKLKELLPRILDNHHNSVRHVLVAMPSEEMKTSLLLEQLKKLEWPTAIIARRVAPVGDRRFDGEDAWPYLIGTLLLHLVDQRTESPLFFADKPVAWRSIVFPLKVYELGSDQLPEYLRPQGITELPLGKKVSQTIFGQPDAPPPVRIRAAIIRCENDQLFGSRASRSGQLNVSAARWLEHTLQSDLALETSREEHPGLLDEQGRRLLCKQLDDIGEGTDQTIQAYWSSVADHPRHLHSSLACEKRPTSFAEVDSAWRSNQERFLDWQHRGGVLDRLVSEFESAKRGYLPDSLIVASAFAVLLIVGYATTLVSYGLMGSVSVSIGCGVSAIVGCCIAAYFDRNRQSNAGYRGFKFLQTKIAELAVLGSVWEAEALNRYRACLEGLVDRFSRSRIERENETRRGWIKQIVAAEDQLTPTHDHAGEPIPKQHSFEFSNHHPIDVQVQVGFDQSPFVESEAEQLLQVWKSQSPFALERGLQIAPTWLHDLVAPLRAIEARRMTWLTQTSLQAESQENPFVKEPFQVLQTWLQDTTYDGMSVPLPLDLPRPDNPNTRIRLTIEEGFSTLHQRARRLGVQLQVHTSANLKDVPLLGYAIQILPVSDEVIGHGEYDEDSADLPVTSEDAEDER